MSTLQGGFGTVQWIEPSQYLASTPDTIVLSQPGRILQVRVGVQGVVATLPP